ncbi:hypothetical protein NP493_1179g00064 [Ridgeia piscesae]|uniref:Uncharacterized protein n=1 Tax=Ridgeia piscesae TaxID=27915 RepID=A0AAD9KEJ3_RIDPI|nr:hypothetical protein NP493_1179g00064 [Ridgeia piscesae]
MTTPPLPVCILQTEVNKTTACHVMVLLIVLCLVLCFGSVGGMCCLQHEGVTYQVVVGAVCSGIGSIAVGHYIMACKQAQNCEILGRHLTLHM